MHNFKLVKEKKIEEIKGTLYEYHHLSGLKLYYIDRNDDNKTFGIAFKTIPYDNSGVFHILEHSVLCGSKKYPSKEPFLELLKGSLNTFLNAMTYKDKTVYPVSSRNDKDFKNLISVYLDAVFNPKIYDTKEIFYQEGWHYTIDENNDVAYKGVVYNEMKGAYSDIDDVEMEAINNIFFKDSAYGFDSGGNPNNIPDLTYEKFIETHQTFYNPSNAYIFVDGKLDIEEIFALVEPYLINYDGQRIDNASLIQKPHIAKVKEFKYEISENEDDSLCRYSKAYLISKYDDQLKFYATNALLDVIAGYNNAPLKKAIMETNLCKDFNISAIDGLYYNFIKMDIKGIKKEDIEQIKLLINRKIKELINNSLDHTQIQASLANYEFIIKENDYASTPVGLIYGLCILDSVLYGGEAELKLEINKYFKEIKELIDTNYFEKLLEELFIDNNHQAEVIFIPDKKYGITKIANEKKRIENEIKSWREEDFIKYQDIIKDIDIWQNKEDDKESLPKLELSDINNDVNVIKTASYKYLDTTILNHEVDTNGIYYTNMYFDIDGLSIDDYTKINFLTILFGKLKTKNYANEELVKELSLYVGNCAIKVMPIALNDKDDVSCKLLVSFSSLKENYNKAKELILEIINNTIINEEVSEDIYKIYNQLKVVLNSTLSSRLHQIAKDRIMGQYFKYGVINDALRGYKYHEFINNLKAQEFNSFIKELNDLRKYFNRNNLVISICGTDDIKEVYSLIDNINPAVVYPKTNIELLKRQNEAIIITSEISSVSVGIDLQEYSGYSQVASKILSLEYLWPNIRQMGGAYGCGVDNIINNFLSADTYRDPSPKRSKDIIMKMGDYLKEFTVNGDIKTSIIGTIADSQPLTTSRLKAQIADMRYFRKIDKEYLLKLKNETLKTDTNDINRIADIISDKMLKATYCVCGNEAAILEFKDIDEIKKV